MIYQKNINQFAFILEPKETRWNPGPDPGAEQWNPDPEPEAGQGNPALEPEAEQKNPPQNATAPHSPIEREQGRVSKAPQHPVEPTTQGA